MQEIKSETAYREARQTRQRFSEQVRLSLHDRSGFLARIVELEEAMRPYELATFGREITGRTPRDTLHMVAVPARLWDDFQDWLAGRGHQVDVVPNRTSEVRHVCFISPIDQTAEEDSHEPVPASPDTAGQEKT